VKTAKSRSDEPTYQVTYQVRLHLALSFHIYHEAIYLSQARAAFRTCRLWVFKEIHLTVSSFLKTILKQFTDGTPALSSDKLFQRLTTR